MKFDSYLESAENYCAQMLSHRYSMLREEREVVKYDQYMWFYIFCYVLGDDLMTAVVKP